MRFEGAQVSIANPRAARRLGIGMVFQHFSLFENLTVAENVALGLDGREPFKHMSARLEQLSRKEIDERFVVFRELTHLD